MQELKRRRGELARSLSELKGQLERDHTQHTHDLTKVGRTRPYPYRYSGSDACLIDTSRSLLQCIYVCVVVCAS